MILVPYFLDIRAEEISDTRLSITLRRLCDLFTTGLLYRAE